MRSIWGFRAAVFVSAFLLFQVQPMMTKALLPSFGGSYLVWGVSAAFYQGMLLIGYAYAHAAQRRLGAGRYAKWHWILILAPLLVLPFDVSGISEACRELPLVGGVLYVLITIVALPVFMLTTTSIILQKWLSISSLPQRENPYVLYGASNLGSLSGLLSYPLLVEPLLDLQHQACVWWAGYALLAMLHVWCRPRNQNNGPAGAAPARAAPLPPGQTMKWFLLSAAGCAALLATTSLITFDLAPVPLLWVLPLSIYLLSFVVTFKRKPWYPKWADHGFYWAVALAVPLYLMPQLRIAPPVWLSVLLQLVVLFAVCLKCHGTLYRARPAEPGRLTAFYLVLAAGGFCGSVLVSWLVPLITKTRLEYPGAFVLAALAFAVRGSRTKPATAHTQPAASARWQRSVPTIFSIAVAAAALTALPWALGRFADMSQTMVFFAVGLPLMLVLLGSRGRPWRLVFVLSAVVIALNWTEDLASRTTSVKKLRNFYGIYKVYDQGEQRYLQHGTTLHGREYLHGSEAGMPLSYFHPSTPAAGILMSKLIESQNVAMIGLGAGSLAGYARKGQTFKIFELDPANLPIAEQYFTFLKAARARGAKLAFAFGDGRISLRREPEDSVDLLVVDAFNSGSIPVHLLTTEAFAEYFTTLKSSGILLLHISNKALNLRPVVHSIANALGAYACSKTNAGHVEPGADETVWMAVTKDAHTYETLQAQLRWEPGPSPDKLPRPWTDRYSNLLAAMF